jgi:hypothetical protein
MPVKKVKLRSDKDIEDDLKTPLKVRSYNPMQVDDLAFCYYCSNLVRPKCLMDFKLYSKDECPIGTLEDVYCEVCGHYEKEICGEGYPVSAEFMGCPKYDGQKIIVTVFFEDKNGKPRSKVLTK